MKTCKVNKKGYEVGDAVIVYNEFTNEWVGAVITSINIHSDQKETFTEYTAVCTGQDSNVEYVFTGDDLVLWQKKVNQVEMDDTLEDLDVDDNSVDEPQQQDEWKPIYHVGDQVFYRDVYGDIHLGKVYAIMTESKSYDVELHNSGRKFLGDDYLLDCEKEFKESAKYKIGSFVNIPYTVVNSEVVGGIILSTRLAKVEDVRLAYRNDKPVVGYKLYFVKENVDLYMSEEKIDTAVRVLNDINELNKLYKK